MIANKKYLVYVLFIFFLLVNVSIDVNAEDEKKTLYVDDDGTQQYTQINDALKNATSGDTIFVYNGIYNGYFSIDKSITLLGESNEGTIIDGNYNLTINSLINIKSDEVTIKNFKIINSEKIIPIENNLSLPFWYYDSGIGILIESDNNIIQDNNISSNGGYGILFNNSQNNLISFNYFSNQIENACIYFKNSSNNTIYGNVFENNIKGIVFQINSLDNLLYYNNFINNTEYHAYTESRNNFYDTTLKKGNYWDDYQGKDKNQDGVGDNEYKVKGNVSADKYPLTFPYQKPEKLIIDDNQLVTMLAIGMVITILVFLPIGYYWRKKYFS